MPNSLLYPASRRANRKVTVTGAPGTPGTVNDRSVIPPAMAASVTSLVTGWLTNTGGWFPQAVPEFGGERDVRPAGRGHAVPVGHGDRRGERAERRDHRGGQPGRRGVGQGGVHPEFLGLPVVV